MSTVFVDTSAWIALFDDSDKHYQEAITRFHLIKEQKIKLLMSDYIFDETITAIRAKVDHKTAVRVGEFLLTHSIY
ncbi:PIN domain-containing protein [Candidatus Magnetobacterium casense]|uniref:PIN domain-containing protein n=1 Tax=Candidatus Magnetobacterium casense TaxID=1455061 RepID=UPI00059088C9